MKKSHDEISIREMRRSKKISAAEMAKVIGCTTGNYFKKENGRLAFNLAEARALSIFLGESIEACFYSRWELVRKNES